MTQQAAALIQIGQLLTKSGLLSDGELADALIRARERDLPIGTVLVTMGRLRKTELLTAVEAQSLVNDGLVSSEMAVSAIVKSSTDGSTFEQALKALGWKSGPVGVTNRLGELLLTAEILDEAQLAEALLTSKETGMLLGRVLVFKGMISEDFLVAALRAQRLVREGLVSRADALDVLRKVQQKKITLAEGLVEGGFLQTRSKRRTPVGYLLVEAGFLKESSLMLCVELSLTGNKSIVDTLVEQGYTSKAVAQASLGIQQLIDSGTLSKDLAAAALRIVESRSVGVAWAVAEVGMPAIDDSRKQSLYELLVLCGSIDPKEIPRIDGDFSSYSALSSTLALTGKIDECLIPCVVRALFLIEKKLLHSEDAVMALHFCRRNQSSLDEALTMMNWKAPTGSTI